MSARLLTRFVLGGTAALMLTLPTAGWSQEATATVTGEARDAESAAPVSSVQIYIADLGIGTLTQADGRFVLLNVPVGTHVVRAERIGYGAESREITVTEGETQTLTFDLAEDALALDEIVVTGTAGQARRREVGNSIAQLDLDEVETPLTTVGSLLQGQMPGARITAGSGNSGSAMDIRLRGNVSVSMSNQPLIYIDGVRSRSEPYPINTSGSGRGIGGGADPPGPLSDLNPADIERIEVVKGPAATTLYGTEAAAGVIQIFTKSGASGAGRWTAEVQQGFSYLRPFATDEVPRLFLDPVLRRGHRQGYSISARGGSSDNIGYFVSGSLADNEGPVIVDGSERWSLRANTQFRIHEDLLIQLNNSFSENHLSQARYGNTISGIMMNANRGDRGYMPRGRSSETLRTLLEAESSQDLQRFNSGVTFNYSPLSDFTHRLTVGYDLSRSEGRQLFPFAWRESIGVTGDLGEIVRNSFQSQLTSVDYVGTLGFDLGNDLRSTFSFGFQGVEREQETLWAVGEDFPGPGDYTIRSTARREGLQDRQRVITGGFFVQDILALSDRYFATLGLRVDGNSAFGQDLGLEPYPKASVSYVISDEGFWPEDAGQMKLRGAYGLAGRAPGAFDAVRTWVPVGWGTDEPAFEPGNLGNPELGPERTRELEVGFDASTLDGRLGVDFTYYAQTTTDALFPVGQPATSGGWSSQLENVGEVRNSGIELNVNGTVVERRSFAWDVGVGLSTNRSEVVSLGGAPPFSVGSDGWIIEGEPVPVIRERKLLNPYEQAEPALSEGEEIYGPAYPTHMINANTSFTLPGGLVLSGRVDYQGGAYISNGLLSSALGRAVPHPVCYDAYRKVDPSWEKGEPGSESGHPVGPRDDLLAWERAWCFGLPDGGLVTSPSDLFEFRNLTLSIPVSNLLPGVAGWSDRADLRISGQNLWYWTREELRLGHPDQNETRQQAGPEGHEFVKSINEQIPPMSYFTVSLRTVF